MTRVRSYSRSGRTVRQHGRRTPPVAAPGDVSTAVKAFAVAGLGLLTVTIQLVTAVGWAASALLSLFVGAGSVGGGLYGRHRWRKRKARYRRKTTSYRRRYRLYRYERSRKRLAKGTGSWSARQNARTIVRKGQR